MNQTQLPRSAAAWRRTKLNLRVHAIAPSGTADYAAAIRESGEYQPTSALKALMASFPSHFRDNEHLLSPVVWRLIYFHPSLWLPRLSDGSFKADAELTNPHYHDWLSEIPSSWLGTDQEAREIIGELRLCIAEAGPDRAKATWAVASTLKWIGLERDDVRQIRWWEVEWLQGLLDHATDDEAPL